MNRIIVLILIVLSPLIINSLEFKVTHFKEDISDLQAISHPQKDQNGEFCSVIRIDTDIKSEIWISEVDIIKKIKVNDSLYYFYINSNEKHIAILSQLFTPLYYKIPVNFEIGKTYSMKLEIIEKIEVEQEGLIIDFYLNHLPDSIKVNNKLKTLEKVINLGDKFLYYLDTIRGENNIDFFKNGYRDIQIKQNFEKPEKISLNFEELMGNVTILTIPDNLLIIKNEHEIGLSPVYNYLEEIGTHILYMKYLNWDIPIKLNVEDGKKTFIFDAEKLLVNLDITTKQTGVTVLLNNKLIGKTPIISFKVGPGNHTLTFEYQNWKPSITVDISHENSSFFFDIEKDILGISSINTIPNNIPTYLDSVYLGKTPIINYKTNPGIYKVLYIYNNWEIIDSIDIKNGFNSFSVNIEEELLGNISINTKPNNLTFYCDEKKIGKTPIEDYKLTTGYHRFAFKNNGLKPSMEVYVKKGKNLFIIDIYKDLLTTVNINTIPHKTPVCIDGKAVGSTPIDKIVITPGIHLLSFECKVGKISLPYKIDKGVNNLIFDIENDLFSALRLKLRPNSYTILNGDKENVNKDNEVYYKNLNSNYPNNIQIYTELNKKMRLSPYRDTKKIYEGLLTLKPGLNLKEIDIENDIISILKVRTGKMSKIYLDKKKIGNNNVTIELMSGNYMLDIKYKNRKMNFSKSIELIPGINEYYFK